MGNNVGTNANLANIAELKDCFVYDMELFAFATDLERVLLQLVDILNTLFKD